MRNGANVVFTFFKTILLQCDTVSNKTIQSVKSPKEAGVMFGGEDCISNQDSFGGISESKTNIALLTEFDGSSSVDDCLSLNNINAGISERNDPMDGAYLNKSRAIFQDLIGDVKIQLILDMKNMIEESRKETKILIEEIRKDMNSTIEDMRKENTGVDANVKNGKKRVKPEHDRRN